MADIANASEVECLTVAGWRLNADSAPVLLRDAEEKFARGVRKLILDLSRVTFIDSLGISALTTILRKAPSGSKIVLASLCPYVQTVARITHLHNAFDIFANVSAAEAALKGSP